MKFFSKAKDGGPDSPVDGYFLFEIKSIGSIALLKFNKGAREAYHTHAFNAWTWFLDGWMVEQKFGSKEVVPYKRSWKPKYTPRDNNHRVIAFRDSWCLTIRGPWLDTWTEDHNGITTVLTHGREVVAQY